MGEQVKKYSNGEITVEWKSTVCTHSKLCWKNLHEVFDPLKRPWINMSGATTEKIIERVDGCPSKALTWYRNDK